MSALAASLLATFGVSLLSFVGLVFVVRNWQERAEVRAIAFAAGVLLATTFLDLLPEALEHAGGDTAILGASLAAMVAFYYLERLIHGSHDHHGHEPHTGHHHASRYFILVGDGIHNFIDGVAIAASFIVSPELGVLTTLAVAAHELPHEVGDYAILVRSGYSRGRALAYNFLSGLTAVLGAVAVFAAGDFVEAHLAWFIAAVAGMFVYIAAANLIPELHHQRVKGRFVYGLPFLAGVVAIVLLTTYLPHAHAEEEGERDHDHGAEQHEAAEEEIEVIEMPETDTPVIESHDHGDGDHGHPHSHDHAHE